MYSFFLLLRIMGRSYGLMQKGYNPRDRKLFENAVERTGSSDYKALYEATLTDLIFEVSQFRIEKFSVSEYTDQFGRQKKFEIKKDKKTIIPMNYILFGFSIEIKVVLLQDNLIAGVFKYYQIPCVEGCNVVYFNENELRYTSPKNKSPVNAVESARMVNANERFDKEISDFIDNIVIPSLFAEMEGKVIVSQTQREEKNESHVPHIQLNNIMNRNVPDRQTDLSMTQQTTPQPGQTITNPPADVPSVQKNSFDFAQPVSELISLSMDEQQWKLKPKKRTLYKTDLERLSNLSPDKKKEIADFILSITTTVNSPIVGEDEIAIYCKKNLEIRANQAIVAFLNGECVGVGSIGKGLYTNLPKNKFGRNVHTLQLYPLSIFRPFSSPVNFSLKNYYEFEWNRNVYIRSN